MNPNIRKIFISGHSSVIDYAGNTAADAIKAKRVQVEMMPFAASGKAPASLSLEKLADCDAVVLLIGNIYGNLQESTQRAIVEMEYDKAKELELDIFVFLLGAELPANNDAKDRKRLDQFIAKIRAENTYCQSPEPLKNLAANVGNAIEQASRYRAFVGAQVFFRSRLVETGGVFQIVGASFTGRKDELDAVSKFHADGKNILFLSGPAGSGKSHLMYEFAHSRLPKGDWIGFWNGLEAGVSALQDIRFDTWKKGLAVIECGDETDLRVVAGLLINILNSKQVQSGQLKLIVTLRDYMRPECQAIWGEIFTDDAACERLALQGLEDTPDGKLRDWVVINAKPITLSRDHARAIIESTRGLPLLIKLALDLVKNKSVSLAELAAGKKFRDVYLDALLKNILGRADLEKFEEFLRLAALLSPYTSDDVDLHKRVAQVLDIKATEWVDLSDKAFELGVLKRTGKVCRIYPEIFADYLVDRGCYGRDGTPKPDWIRAILDAFLKAEVGGGIYARHTAAVVRNLAATEFRHQEPLATPSPLWTGLEDAFQAADNLAKQQWLKLFREIAYYKPSWAINLAKKVMAESKDYPRQQVWRNHFVSGQELVNDLAVVLFPAANHLDHLREASNLLWEICLLDKRKPGPNPEHAFRLLENLIEYKSAKPIIYTDRLLDATHDWLRNKKWDLGEERTPVLLVGKAFSKQIEHTDWFRHSLSIGTTFLKPREELIALRAKARGIIAECLDMKYGILCARQAIAALTEDVKPPHGIGGAAFSPELQAEWVPEQLKSLESLQNFCASGAPFPLKYSIEGKLKWIAKNHPIAELRNPAKSLCEKIAADPEFQFIEVLVDRGFEDRTQARDVQAKKIVAECRTPSALIAKCRDLSDLLVTYYSDNYRMGLGGLVHAIGRADVRLGLNTAKQLLDSQSPKELLWLANPLMAPARADANLFPDYLELVQKIVRDNITEALSNLPSWYMGLSHDLRPEEWPVIEQLTVADSTKHNDMTFFILRAMSKRDADSKQKVKELLLKLPDVGPSEARVADARCHAMAREGREEGLVQSDLSEAEARQFTWKIMPLDELSADSYKLAEWLAYLGENYPDLLVEFFVERMRHSKQLGKGKGDYRAIPLDGDFQQYFGKTSAEAKEKLVKQLFELLGNEEGSEDYDVRSLIWHVLSSDCGATARSLSEIQGAGGEAKIKKLIYLLQEAPPAFATGRDGDNFVPEFLVTAKALSSDILSRAVSALVISATSGPMISEGDKPPENLVALMSKCEEKLKELKSDSPSHQFYRALKDHVAFDLKRYKEEGF